MNPNAIPSIDALGSAPAVPTAGAATPASPVAGFDQWFTQQVSQVDAQLVGAQQGVQQLAAGGGGQLHDTMLQLEQARLQFQLAIQVRNHVVDAYQDVMRMQV